MESQTAEYSPAVRTSGAPSLDAVLSRRWRKRGELEADAADRRAVPANAVLRQPPDDPLADFPEARCEPQAGPTVDAVDGPGGRVPQTEAQPGRRGPQDLPVFVEGFGDISAQPGVGHRHHVHPDGLWFHVPDGHPRLAQSVRAVVANFQQPGKQLARSAGGESIKIQ